MWLMQVRPGSQETVPVFAVGPPLPPGRVPSDCCGAPAWVRVLVGAGSPLDFCAHHYEQHRSVLNECSYPFDDQRGRLLETEADVRVASAVNSA